MGTWIVRGFGTAIMHGGATAIFAVMGLAMLERAAHASAGALPAGIRRRGACCTPAFNHLSHSPLLATLAIMLALPPALMAGVRAQRAGAAATGSARASTPTREMLELINSGQLRGFAARAVPAHR